MSAVTSSQSASYSGVQALQRTMAKMQEHSQQIASGNGSELDGLIGLSQDKTEASAAIKAIDVENRTLGKVIDVLA